MPDLFMQTTNGDAQKSILNHILFILNIFLFHAPSVAQAFNVECDGEAFSFWTSIGKAACCDVCAIFEAEAVSRRHRHFQAHPTKPTLPDTGGTTSSRGQQTDNNEA